MTTERGLPPMPRSRSVQGNCPLGSGEPISRRTFAALSTGIVIAGLTELQAEEKPKVDTSKAPVGPIEAAFERDYAAPTFKPSWKKPQINRLLVQDFVIYA